MTACPTCGTLHQIERLETEKRLVQREILRALLQMLKHQHESIVFCEMTVHQFMQAIDDFESTAR
jgi:hypothetical protein